MRQSIRILQLHDSAGMYGTESVIINLSKALSKTYYEPIIGCMTKKHGTKPLLGDTAETSDLKTRYFPMKYKFDPLTVRQIVTMVKESGVRLIHCHGYKSNLVGLICAKMTRISIITTNHLFPPMPLNDKKLQMYSKLDAHYTMKRLDKVVAVSEDIKAKLAHAGIHRTKIKVIENGIDLEPLQQGSEAERTRARQSLGVQEGSFVIGTLGRLTPQKAHDVLLEATKQLLEKNNLLTVIIAGDGPLEAQLKIYAEQLNISHAVKFLGFRKNIAELLQTMDLFVLSSVDEGLPMALLEAMAMKVPAIATEVGDVPKVIRNMETGILVKPNDATMLAEGFAYLINNNEHRAVMAANAYENVKQYHSKEAMCAKYCEVYDEVLQTSRHHKQ
jgi:glycosyltransferase involved in cell wall biosynthesis